MSKYEMVALVVTMSMMGATAMTLITSWFRYREKKLMAGERPRPEQLQDERLARIEAAVEAIAVEVERISEGQRFTTKLLAERTAALAVAPGEHAYAAEERRHGA